MRLIVNGELEELDPDPPTLSKVINLLDYHPKLIVVEYNGTILPPSKWNTQQIKDEDSIEIVTIVGGGS